MCKVSNFVIESVVNAVDGLKGLEPITTHKPNGIDKDGLRLIIDNEVMPVIYTDNYDGMEEGEQILKLITTCKEALKAPYPMVDDFLDMGYNDLIGKIEPHAHSLKASVDYLQGKFYRVCDDIAITYHYVVCKYADVIASIAVTRDMMKAWGITALDLETLAEDYVVSNCYIQSMLDMMLEKFGDVMSESEIKALREDADNGLYIVTNKTCVNGAGVIGFADAFGLLLKDKGITDCYILPSSIHEVLVVTDMDGIDGVGLLDMVTTINATSVKQADKLTDSVYRYTVGYGIRKIS